MTTSERKTAGQVAYDPPCPDMSLNEQVKHARGFAAGICRNDHYVARLLEQMARSIEGLQAAACAVAEQGQAEQDSASAALDGIAIALVGAKLPFSGDYSFKRENAAASMRKIVNQLEDEFAKLRQYKPLFEHALNCVDQVFQECTEISNPILPDFARLGEDKFEAVVRLAKEYKQQ